MKQIERKLIDKLIESEDVTNFSVADLQQLFRQEQGIQRSVPDGVYQIDPRTGDIVLFVTSREVRPQDTLPVIGPDPQAAKNCPICLGQTTGIVDVAPLSQGMTFINKNLYPVFFPFDQQQVDAINGRNGQTTGPVPQTVSGLHFLQWTSSDHGVDWHNLPEEDGIVVMSRLAALEKTLLEPGKVGGPRYVVMVKNYGRLVGSSLAHGHQQIALSSVMPRRFADNARFARKHGETFAAFMLRENPSNLLIRDYGPVVLLVPYFMRRPYDMMLILKDVSKQYLHQLSEAEITAVANGWRDATRAIVDVMNRNGREVAYNIISNNGPGAGLFFEFLPYTQEMGSFEHLGLVTSEAEPGAVAEELKKTCSSQRKTGNSCLSDPE